VSAPKAKRREPAARRLDAVSAQLEASRKAAKALAKRLNATRKDGKL
jgi:hypothetical protein